jgi:putative DNA primase/helicase
VLRKLIGDENVDGPTLKGLSNEFGLQSLVDKSLAIISDARWSAGFSSSTAAERLLAISGEDSLTINRKYRDHWHGRLGARILIFTNELPELRDASGALASRFVIWVQRNSFFGKEDTTLDEQLLEEMPGILNWALDGIDMLADERKFKLPEASKQAQRNLEMITAPHAVFAREMCDVRPSAKVKVSDMWDAWNRWAIEKEIDPGNNIAFGRDVFRLFPAVQKRGRNPSMTYHGIGLRNPTDLVADA